MRRRAADGRSRGASTRLPAPRDDRRASAATSSPSPSTCDAIEELDAPSETGWLANALRTDLARRLSVRVSASIGIATSPGPRRRRSDLLRCADVAMYEAKERHDDRAPLPTGGRRHSRERLTLIGDLRTAIEANGPRPALPAHPSTCTPARSAASRRWCAGATRRSACSSRTTSSRSQSGSDSSTPSPECGPRARRSPSSGTARRAGPRRLQMSVNISRFDLLDESSPRSSTDAARANLPGERLTLEITESSIGQDPERSRQQIEQLRRLGVRISIDDFGVGYSSMSQLLDAAPRRAQDRQVLHPRRCAPTYAPRRSSRRPSSWPGRSSSPWSPRASRPSRACRCSSASASTSARASTSRSRSPRRSFTTTSPRPPRSFLRPARAARYPSSTTSRDRSTRGSPDLSSTQGPSSRGARGRGGSRRLARTAGRRRTLRPRARPTMPSGVNFALISVRSSSPSGNSSVSPSARTETRWGRVDRRRISIQLCSSS